MSRHYMESTRNTARLLGLQVATARREQGRQSSEIAERAGISRVTLSRIEAGNPTVAIGSVFEVCFVLGIRLFGADGAELADLVARQEREVALLPQRIRTVAVNLDDDF